MTPISWTAILLCAASAFLIGGLWYSPGLFGRIWKRESGQGFQPGHAARVYAASFVFACISAFAFVVGLGDSFTFIDAIRQGTIVGVAFVAASFGINYQFAGRSMRLWAIDAGYHIVQFTLYGLIVGLWHA